MYHSNKVSVKEIRMKAKQLKALINSGLIVSFIGLLIAFPIKDQLFIGGLLFAICSASLIGGLADSFAVKAIFGQPLNIKWPSWLGTNIIVRQRQRLVDELVHMVQYELLSPDSIREALKDKKLSRILQSFLASETGQATVKQLLNDAIKEAVKAKHLSVIVIGLKKVMLQLSTQAKPSKHVATIVDYIVKENLDDTIAAFVVRMLQPLVKHAAFKAFITEILQAAITKYEKDNRRRQVANQMANIDHKQLSEKIIAFIEQWLFEFIAKDHALRIKIRESVLAFVERIEQDETFAEHVDTRCRKAIEVLASSLTKGHTLMSYFERLEQSFAAEDEEELIYKWSQAIVESIQARLEQATFSAYDEHLLKWIISIVERKQDVIGKLVKEKLNQYTTESLIELVEDKAGKDLQFIRLNGALVGGLIGALLFIVQFAIGGILS